MKWLQNISNWMLNILEIWRVEMRNSLFDEGAVVFFFIVPLLYPLLYSYLYSHESVREVATVVVDNANTSLSREFIRKVDATGDVKIVGHCAEMQEAKELIYRRKAYCIIYIPEEFEKELQHGRQSTIELFSDMGSLLYYEAIYSACNEVSLDMNMDIKAQRLPGATEEQTSMFCYPMEYEYVPMFNTQSGFASYVIPAVLMLVIQQTMLVGIGLLAGNEREKKRKGILLRYQVDKKPSEMLFGKASTYVSIYVTMSAYLFFIVPSMFNLIHIWQLKEVLAFMFPYLLACVFFSITISGLSHDREVFIIMFMFMSVPLMFISGISWPTCAVPKFWRVVSWFFPSTFGINGFVKINNMGALVRDVKPELIGLWVQAFFYGFTAWLVYKRSYGKNLKNYVRVEESEIRLVGVRRMHKEGKSFRFKHK